ncbi:response regulator [Pelomonas sp. CA6]|uniref:response regulator n=1 Tax=Pelomonas sp. CA6 TaxID=2907999 RepID=UPI001F4C18E9|nr:response regulator [Pelomonas sp. CA6]MCH7345032.1 response regulator [Pelomonas sp. CA6]
MQTQQEEESAVRAPTAAEDNRRHAGAALGLAAGGLGLLAMAVLLRQPSVGLVGLGLLAGSLLWTQDQRRSEQRQLAQLRDELARERRLSAEMRRDAERDSHSQSRFVAVMSHEIRNPLNGILGMTQLLEQSELSAKQREQVHIVRRSGRHLLTLVNDILDLARIESGKLVLDAQPVVLREVVDDVCRLLGETARGKGLDFRLDLAPGLPERFMGDASRIQQILHNLVGNAIKFTAQGTVRVQVSALQDMHTGTLLRFAVQDSGEGIPADQMERIFAPFEQVASAPGAQREGSGLGLTISRELARAMGGELRCSSTLGLGSVFEFTLPLQPCAAVEPAGSPAVPAPPAEPPRLSGRVLLVDDNAVNLLVAAGMLERFGMDVVPAENGLQALEQLQAQAFDLVLMDCQMPEMDGFEATQRWRAREAAERRARTPIVALTASAVNEDRHRCLACGMDDYLVKPFEMEALVALVQRHVPAPAATAAPTAVEPSDVRWQPA